MHGNTFGRMFRLTTYGESHGLSLGGVLDGCPAGLDLSGKDIQKALDERRPGPSVIGGEAATARHEPDRVRLLSGIFNGKTTGTPIAFNIENTNLRSEDYEGLSHIFRPGHADLGFQAKYGIRDHRGGGRSSGRETVSRVAGGAIAQIFLATQGVAVMACTLELGGRVAPLTDMAGAGLRPYFCPDEATVSTWNALVKKAKENGDTVGGLVRIEINGLPPGLGEPVFDKFDARLAYAFMGIGAVKGVEIGSGFTAARTKGSENNDPIIPAGPGMDIAPIEHRQPVSGGALNAPGQQDVHYAFAGNNAGGIIGGISTGAPVVATVAVKPISSIGKAQKTIDIHGRSQTIQVGGRHDISAIPRIVPVLKAMAALTAADFLLLQRGARV